MKDDINHLHHLSISLEKGLSVSDLVECKPNYSQAKNWFMENKALAKREAKWPTLFDSGWMEKFFNAPIDEFFYGGRLMNVPAVNVTETEKNFTLVLAVPGMEKKDFKIETLDDILTISAEKETEHKEEKNGRFNRREYNFNSWTRSFTLPENCNTGKIDATYVNGELKIVLPKMEIFEPKKVKNIAVN